MPEIGQPTGAGSLLADDVDLADAGGIVVLDPDRQVVYRAGTLRY